MKELTTRTRRLLELLGHDEEPLGIYYTDTKSDGFGPRPGEIYSREREQAGEINWQKWCRPLARAVQASLPGRLCISSGGLSAPCLAGLTPPHASS